MNRAIFIAAALLLAGCETEDGWVPGESARTEQTQALPVRSTAPVIAQTPIVAPPPIIASAAPPPVVPPPPPAAPPPPDDMTAATEPPPVDAHCQAVAHQRSTDARANGYTFEMAQTIYDGTYRDCIAWDSQHGPALVR